MTITVINPTLSSYRVYGRVFTTNAFQTDAETNDFLTAHPDYGMIGEDENGIHCARMDDEGMLADR